MGVKPFIDDNALPKGFIEWSDGDEVPGKSQLHRRVSKSKADKIIVTAKIGTSSKTAVTYVIWADATGFSTSHYPE